MPRKNLNLPTVEIDGQQVPVIKNINARILRRIEHEGYGLEMSNWHTCDTVHCIAGHAVNLCGSQADDLLGTIASQATLIFRAAGESHPPFFSRSYGVVSGTHEARLTANRLALAALRRLAALNPLPDNEPAETS
jgi:hypothetical protein